MSAVLARRDNPDPSTLHLVKVGERWLLPQPFRPKPGAKPLKRPKIKIKSRKYRLRDLTKRGLDALAKHPIMDYYYDSGPDGPLVVVKSSSDGIVAHVTRDQFEARLQRHLDFVELDHDKEWQPVRSLPPGLCRDILGLKEGLSDYFPDAKAALDVEKHGEFLLWLVARIKRFGQHPQQMQWYSDDLLAKAKQQKVKQRPRTNESCGKLVRRLDRAGFWAANHIDFTAFDHDAGGSRYGAIYFPDEPSVATAEVTVVSNEDDSSNPNGTVIIPAPDLTNDATWEEDEQ
jgi:hypothetical protein